MLKDYIAVDLEMTGLDPRRDHILEIGAVKVKDKKVQGTFSRLIRQEDALKEQIVKLTGITDEMAAAGDEPDAAVEAFLEFAEDCVWVGHNVIFDYSFIRQWEINHRIKRTCYGVDTLKIARKCLPELEKKTLDFLCGYYQIAGNTRHRALEDAQADQALYEILEQNFLEKQPGLFVKKELQYKAKRQTPATPRQKNYLKVLMKYYKIEPDVPIEQLTRSDASRLTDKILRQYGRI